MDRPQSRNEVVAFSIILIISMYGCLKVLATDLNRFAKPTDILLPSFSDPSVVFSGGIGLRVFD